MDINYLDNISKQLSQYDDKGLISSSYWDIIYNNLYLTHELLKLHTFQLFTEINPDFFQEDIICLDLLGYENPPCHYIPSHIMHSQSFWIHALELNHTYISNIPENLLISNQNLSFWICEKFSNHPVIEYFPTTLKNNFDLVYFAVENNPDNYFFISEELKNSPYIFEIIYKKNSKICKSSDYFMISGKDIRSNYKFSKKSIIENPSSFSTVDESLKNEPSFFFDMLNYSDNILQYAHSSIKKNEYCVIASIEKNPLSLEFADNYFKSSIDFLLSIYHLIEEYNNFSEFAKIIDQKVFSDHRFVTQYFNLIAENSCHYLLGNSIRSDSRLMLMFCSLDINSFQYASSNLKKDISFIRACYDLHNQNNTLEQFNVDSTQSSLFSMIEESNLNDITFINNLYKEFKPIFKDIIFPIIQKKNTALTQLLSNELNIEIGLSHILGKFELKNKLEQHLNANVVISKGKKI